MSGSVLGVVTDKQLARMVDEIDRLKAENARLRRALGFFLDGVVREPPLMSNEQTHIVTVEVTAKRLRIARAALNQQESTVD